MMVQHGGQHVFFSRSVEHFMLASVTLTYTKTSNYFSLDNFFTHTCISITRNVAHLRSVIRVLLLKEQFQPTHEAYINLIIYLAIKLLKFAANSCNFKCKIICFLLKKEELFIVSAYNNIRRWTVLQ